MDAAAKRMKDFRPDVGNGKMQQVMSYATGGKPRTTKHLKLGTKKPGDS
jgi:hypothetical protein